METRARLLQHAAKAYVIQQDQQGLFIQLSPLRILRPQPNRVSRLRPGPCDVKKSKYGPQYRLVVQHYISEAWILVALAPPRRSRKIIVQTPSVIIDHDGSYIIILKNLVGDVIEQLNYDDDKHGAQARVDAIKNGTDPQYTV